MLGQGRNAIALHYGRKPAGLPRVPTPRCCRYRLRSPAPPAHYTRALFEHDGHTVGLLDADLLRQALSRSLS